MNKIDCKIIKRINSSYDEWVKGKKFNPELDKAFRTVWVESAIKEAQLSADTILLALKIITEGDPISIGLDEVSDLCKKALNAYHNE
ncbi:MAG: hypothetical protein N4A49_01870 [Marinifilaceae bacterium]|jgi:hypothetical protein|nr:hypothetical protein [Marinifilaceae bacterium]